ncbi:hypothetical protein [Clostridium senegalense]|uniref:Uncharacterized protein n=1 Tax=Clostridium senegalense TaxID=1465809 RepID=A0A6M0H6X3_9CLOT|nr:hypothetical protein [Clostridium senegalense]NEU06287.1 hypothetical protein [Clostridium senegalense]
MKELNNYIRFGILFYGMFLISNCFNIIPEFIKGLCVGIGFALIFLGIYSEKHDMSKLKNCKKELFKKFV